LPSLGLLVGTAQQISWICNSICVNIGIMRFTYCFSGRQLTLVRPFVRLLILFSGAFCFTLFIEWNHFYLQGSLSSLLLQVNFQFFIIISFKLTTLQSAVSSSIIRIHLFVLRQISMVHRKSIEQPAAVTPISRKTFVAGQIALYHAQNRKLLFRIL
jgi:hypothetical protein